MRVLKARYQDTTRAGSSPVVFLPTDGCADRESMCGSMARLARNRRASLNEAANKSQLCVWQYARRFRAHLLFDKGLRRRLVHENRHLRAADHLVGDAAEQ